MDDRQQIINHWLFGVEDALVSVQSLYNNRQFHHALFFGQLALEKRIKAQIVQDTNSHPLPTHNLRILALKTSLPFTNEQIEQLVTISKFNLEARYDEYKHAFYKTATKEYADKWITIIKDLLLWIDKQPAPTSKIS